MTSSQHSEKNSFFRESPDCIEDNADKVKSISEFHLECHNDTARSAVIYNNGRNQLPVRVRLSLLDEKSNPVKLSQRELLKEGRLKFYKLDGTRLEMKPLSDQNKGLTYWDKEEDFAQAANYKTTVKFIKPTTHVLDEFNVVDIEVIAAARSGTSIKRLILSYKKDPGEWAFHDMPYDSPTINVSKRWCFRAGDFTLQAKIIDDKGEEFITTHDFSVPVPKDRPWVNINTPTEADTFSPGEEIKTNIVFQAHENKTLTRVSVNADGSNLNGNTFSIYQRPITMPDSGRLKVSAMGTASDQKYATQTRWINPRKEQNQYESVAEIASSPQESTDDTQSVAVLYFATADDVSSYDFYAELDLPEVSGSTQGQQELKIESLEAIDYADTSKWTFEAMPASTPASFKANDKFKDCLFTVQEFRFKYPTAHPAFFSVRNIGTAFRGGVIGDKGGTWFYPSRPLSALLWHNSGSAAGANVDINAWTVLAKPYDNHGAKIGFTQQGSEWQLKTGEADEDIFSFTMNDEHAVTDQSTSPYDYFSVWRAQIRCQEVGSAAVAWQWKAINHDSKIEIIDIYGNRGTITTQYKSDSFNPVFPPEK
ncbi:hypothetical protein [Winslowiella iniecta]|uniref:Uncharacterized protein n=1 Tax=Winslowiella iniecta TaxID=1560201 RepID=A0A0L7TII6_9GAMM|nr:hypothetical protein [Winslowiella iniecta]KOC91811.1 hypothetical protein NG42_03340 [Winslowiella iniecta]KOC95061.1 hypothetical protein NG43_02375 [Winslowiella iniecta]